MNGRMILSHLVVGLLALGLGYALSSARHGAGSGSLARSEDPVAALTAALSIEEADERAQALLDFFAAADPAWAERLRAEVNQPDSKLVLDEVGEALFAEWWARSNPEAAFANLVDPAWANRHPWVREVMRAWVAKDPTSAAAAADSLPPNPDRGKVEATRVLVQHWWDKQATSDPGPLLALIQKLEIRPRGAAIEALIRNSIKARGIDATEQFVEALPDGDPFGADVRQEMLGRYGQALLDHDVDRAAAWATKHGQGREGSGILRHLAFSWGVKDGAAAMNWAINLPDTPERPAIILRVWVSYRQAHPEEASQWLLAREPDAVLENVWQRFLTGTAGVDAAMALEVASRTKDPMLRERLLSAVGVGWMRSDPEAAKKWLDTVELAPELEDRVRQSAPVTPPQNLSSAPGA